MKAKSVGELRKLLESVPDEAVVLIGIDDHALDQCGLAVTTAVFNKKYGGYYEYHGDQHMGPGDEKITALVVGG